MTPRRSNIILTVALCALLPPFTARLMPNWFNDSIFFALAGVTAIVAGAIALNLLMGYAGQVSLGHAALLGVGAFTSGLLTSQAGFPLPLTSIPGGQSMILVGVPAAAILGGLAALIIGFPALRLRGLYLAIATVGFVFAMKESVFRMPAFSRGSAGVQLPRRIWGDTILGLNTPFSEGGKFQNADYLVFALLLVVLLWLLDANVVRSKLGRAFHGIREDEAVAQSFGVDVTRFKLLAFVLSGAMAGVAGALAGYTIGFTNNEAYTFEDSLSLVIVVVVGGLGSRLAVTIAAVFFVLFPKILHAIEFKVGALVFHIDPVWAIVIGSVLLIYTVAKHPGGFAEIITEARERQVKRRQGAGHGPEVDDIDEAGRMPKLPVLPRPSGLPPRADVSGPNVLMVQDVTVRFGGLIAVDRATLEVPRGQIVGLIGPNGAGKSTLFNAVSGFVAPDAGTIRLFGREIQNLPPHERARLGIGRTFQNIGLAKNLTLLDNLLLAQHVVAGYDVASALLYLPKAARVERELEQRAKAAIAALGFEQFTDTAVKNLSHGQQRIAELGCALVTAPELLMLDEPSAGMSPGAAENLALRLRDLRDELGRTVLLIEHNVPLVLDVCDYIYVLNYGAILAHGTTEVIAREPQVIAAYFGEAAA